MDRKKIVLAAAAFVLLAAAVFTYISLSGNKTAFDNGPASLAGGAASVPGSVSGAAASGEAEETTAPAPQIIKSEELEIAYNSPEYDLKALLREYSDRQSVVELEYYLDGTGTSMEIGGKIVPELESIFENRTGAGQDSYKVKGAYLNPVYSKLYLQIAGKAYEGFEDTALYSVDLKEQTVKKLFSYVGKYSKMLFNKSFSLLGYSFDDPPVSSVFQENTLFEILDCKTDEFKVRGSRVSSGNKAGAGRDAGFIYDYSFLEWKSDTVARLKQSVIPIKGPAGKPSVQGEILYDVEKDGFTDTDGSPLTGIPSVTGPADSQPTDAQPSEAAKEKPADAKAASEASKILTDFYSYLSSEKDYQKGMELLDGDFKLQLSMLEQFGASEIIKSDIDEENASMFSNILKAARLESVVKTETDGGVCTIYYYQTLSLNADSQVKQALKAQLKKVKGAYKIYLISDADEKKPPFAR